MDRSRNAARCARSSPRHPRPHRRGTPTAAERLEGRTLFASISGTVYDDLNADGTYDPPDGEYGLVGIRVYHDANNNGLFDSGTADFYAPAINLPRPIRDGTTTTSRITVEDSPGTVRDVNVTVNIEHTYTYDLEVTLVSPTGREVTLFDNVGMEDFLGRSMDFTNTVLDDEAGSYIEEGEPPYTGSYQPMESLSLMDGETMNGTWTLRIRDWGAGDEGQLLDWGLSFDVGAGEPNTLSGGDGTYTLADLPPGAYRIRQVVFDGYRQTQPTGDAPHLVTLGSAGQQVTNRDFGQSTGAPAASVVGRHLFYNNSAFDGRDRAANARDDDAIDPDKTALQPGMTASVSSYSNYSRGINGVMVDVSGLPAGAAPSAADFGFKVGNDPNPSGWQDLAVAPTVTLRRGEGFNGSDRVTLTWPDGTVVGKWLQVTVQPTANTGLASPDVFYYGNLPGEVGDSFTNIRVTSHDVMRVRSDYGSFNPDIDDWFDFNRDRRINLVDYAIARANVGRSLHVLTAPAAGAAGVQAAAFGDVPVSGRRSAYRPPRAWGETERDLLA